MPIGKIPGRTHYLDELAPGDLDQIEREATERLRALLDDVADIESQLEQIKLARAEQERRQR